MERLLHIYSSAYSWIGSALVFLATFFGDTGALISYCCLASLLDLFSGLLRSARVSHRGVVSSGLVDFVLKNLSYIMLFVCFVFLDHILRIEDAWFTRAYTAIIVFGEIISMLANLSVTFPRVKVFALVGRLLAAEVAAKLGISKEELNELNESSKNETETDKNS